VASNNKLLTGKKERILILSFLLFFISLFLFRLASSYTVGMCVVGGIALFYNSNREKAQLFRERRYLWFMFAFAILMVFSFLVSDNKAAGMQFLLRRLPLFVFPLTIGLIPLSRKQRDSILLAGGVITSIGCLCSFGYAFYRYQQVNNSAWLYNDALTDLIRQQSIYTSVLVNISIYSFVHYLLNYRPTVWKKIMIIIAIAFLLGISYLLASRNMMLLLYASIFLFAVFIIINRKKYLAGLGLLATIAVAITVIFLFFPKTINRFKELAFTQFNYESQAKESHYAGELTPEQWNGANFRLAAWPCGWEVFKKKPVIGVGLGDKKDELVKVYKAKKFQFAISTGKNVHNNYLDILMSMGVIGLLVFLMGWAFLPLIRIIKNRDKVGFLILLTFLIAMITENYFDRSLGVVLFSFFVPFLLSVNTRNQE
jgi:O-antigen ligase